MHEVSLVSELIRAACAALEQSGATGRVLEVHVAVGRFSCASPEALRFAFEPLASGTRLDGARLVVAPVETFLVCRTCGARTVARDLWGACPECGETNVQLEGGRDLVLESLEVEDDEEGEGADMNGVDVDGRDDVDEVEGNRADCLDASPQPFSPSPPRP